MCFMRLTHADVRENEEQTMARFLAGMNYAIKHIVNHHPYNDMIELLHQAHEAERQVSEDVPVHVFQQMWSSHTT